MVTRSISSKIVFSLSIALFCLISTAGIAQKSPKADNEKGVISKFIRQVVPSYDNDPYLEKKVIDNFDLYPAKQNKKLVGIAVKSSSEGYSGPIILMVGFLPKGTIYNISVISENETEDLGTHVNDPAFKNQFKGKNPSRFKLKVKKDGGQVDAITSATISSRAFCEAVNKAYKIFSKNVKSFNTEK